MLNMLLVSLGLLVAIVFILVALWRRDERVGRAREAEEKRRRQQQEDRKHREEVAPLTVLARNHQHQPQA